MYKFLSKDITNVRIFYNLTETAVKLSFFGEYKNVTLNYALIWQLGDYNPILSIWGHLMFNAIKTKFRAEDFIRCCFLPGIYTPFNKKYLKKNHKTNPLNMS